MPNLFKKKYLKSAFDAFSNNCDAFLLLYGEENSYEVVHANDLFSSKLNDKGSFKELYISLFMQTMKDGENIDEKYNHFVDTSLFRRNNYYNRFFLQVDHTIVPYFYRVLQLEDNVFAMFIMLDTLEHTHSDALKLDVIQQNYLFSMIVNLKDDSCVNSNIPELTGVSPDHLDIKYSQWRWMIREMFLPEDQEAFLSFTDPSTIMERTATDSTIKYETKMRNMKGVYIWVRLSFSRTTTYSESNPTLLFTVTDINDDVLRLLNHEKIIDEIQKKNTELVQENEKKNYLISFFSHELRTPLNAIIGMNEIILRNTNDSNILDYAKNMKDAGNLLLSIVNNALDYSRLNAGKMKIIPINYSVKQMLNDVSNIIELSAEQKQLDFNMTYSDTIPATLIGDDIRIKQVLINLLSNSIKYTKEGSVSLSVDFMAKDQNEGDLIIKITDTGMGMRQEDMDKLFHAFERIDESNNRHIEGTGLGMSIVLMLLNQMDSELEVNSKYGEGTTFSFVLHQGIASSETAEITYKDDNASLYHPNKRILVIDDVKTNLVVVEGLLNHSGIQVDTAISGIEGLEKMKSNKYDAILLDHLMPEMDGIETLNELRQINSYYKEVPVIAMTANVCTGSNKYYLNAGFNDYLEKPMRISQISEVLNSVL